MNRLWWCALSVAVSKLRKPQGPLGQQGGQEIFVLGAEFSGSGRPERRPHPIRKYGPLACNSITSPARVRQDHRNPACVTSSRSANAATAVWRFAPVYSACSEPAEVRGQSQQDFTGGVQSVRASKKIARHEPEKMPQAVEVGGRRERKEVHPGGGENGRRTKMGQVTINALRFPYPTQGRP
jgi:hypothetical protein